MKRRGLVGSMLMCALLLCASAAGAQAPAPAPVLGMILGVEGDVAIQRGTERTPARRVDFLYAADKLVIGAAGRADVLVCPSSERWVLAAGASLEFATGVVKQTAGPNAEKKAAKCALPDIRTDDKNRLRFGGFSPRGDPPIALMIGGTITRDRPAFDWIAVENAQLYRIEVRDERGDLVWEAQTASNHLDYPIAEAALGQGTYQWRVRAESNGKIVAQQTASLKFQPNAALSAQVSESPADRLMRAAELEEAHYYAEAGVLYRQLRDADPGNSRLTLHLVWIYGNAELFETAKRELARTTAVK